MKRVFPIFLLFSLCTHYAFAQDITTLKGKLSLAKEDTTRIRLLNDICDFAYINYAYDTCIKYSSIALEISNNLLNQPEVKSNPVLYLQYQKLKARSLANYGSAYTFENGRIARDSLLAASILWHESKDKTGTAFVFLRLAELYMNQYKLDAAINYFNASLSLYKELKIDTYETLIYYEMALTQRYMANYGDALESNLVALNLSSAAKDTISMLQCLLSNGFIYMQVKDYKEALKTQMAALQIATSINDQSMIATTYSDLGVTNFRAGNYDEALKNHYKALEIRKKINEDMFLSNTYNYISDILTKQGKFKEALVYNLESVSLGKILSDKRSLMDAYFSTGNNYLNLGLHQTALKYFDSTFDLSEKLSDTYYMSNSLLGSARTYIQMNNDSKAISILQKALTVTYVNDFRSFASIYDLLRDIYAKSGNYEMAYLNILKYNQYEDSVLNLEKSLKITSLTNQLNFENKRALLKASQDKQLTVQEAQIEKQKIIRNIIIIGLIAVIALAILFFKRFKEKQKLNEALENTVHELKSTQAQLIQSEKMASLGELTAGIAHEIQNPLNFVNNFSELNNELIDEMNTEIEGGNLSVAKEIAADIKSNAAKINHHGKRAEAIVKGMLQHSRKSTGQKEPTDINALCDEYLRLSYHGLRAKDKSFNAKFETVFDEQIGKINIVPQDMGRALLNLINNAFYACTERSRSAATERSGDMTSSASTSSAGDYVPIVKVLTKKENNKVIISVKDNGNGIPQDIQEKIFQPFFTTKPAGKGTGLGLSMTYDIITKLHEGNIKVESKEGEGTIFIIEIPAT